MPFAERFEDLRVWQEARVSSQSGLFSVYEEPGFRIPGSTAARSDLHDEQYRGRIRAEDSEDFSHFLDLAKGSCGEVRSMLYVAEDLGYLSADQALGSRQQAEKLSCGIAALAKHWRS